MKKILIIVALCLLSGYIVFAIFYFGDKPKDELCTKLDITIINSGNEQFIKSDDIKKYIDRKDLNPYGKTFREINTQEIEEAILTNKLIKKAEVFTTNSGTIKINIYERKPIVRVITNNGESYYIDDEGSRMPLSNNYTAYVPVATGAIKESFAKNELYKFALFLTNNSFWNAQMEQIVVAANESVTLIPRVGDHEIILGELRGYEDKLDKLMTFYEKGLSQSGWNKYSVINLKYDKQVVCTKR